MPARFKFTVASREACHPCCAGEGCIIAQSQFNDTAGFTTDGTVSGGLLTLASGQSMTFDAAAATEDDGQILITFADTSASTATVRLLIAYVDADNYLFGEFAIAAGVGTLRIGHRVGGSDEYFTDPETITDTSTDLTDRHRLAICWEPGEPVDTESFSTGPLLPFEVVSSTGWSQPDNVLLDDGNVATYDLPSNTVSEGITVDWEGMLPQFPIGSTIDGIIVAFRGGHDLIGADVTASVELSIGGDSDTKGPTAVTSGSNVYLFGGAADDWGFGLLGEDVNGSPVGVSLSFDNNELIDGVQITVDVITINFYYTTRDRRPGILTFSLKNNGSGLYQCAKHRQVFSAGLKAGMRSQVDTWDFTEATFYYLESAARPECPNCSCATPATVDGCEKCDAATPPYEEWVVDLGIGGWTDSGCCNGCPEVQGEYVLTPWVFAGGECNWLTSDTIGSDPEQCAVILFLALADGGGGQSKWTLAITTGVGGGLIGGPCAIATVNAQAYYESDPFDPDQCQEAMDLNKIADFGGTCTTGGLPATIALAPA